MDIKPVIHLATVGEESFKYGLAVMFQSVCDSLNEQAQVQFHIVDINLKPETRRALQDMAEKNPKAAGVSFLDAEKSPTFLKLASILTGSKRFVPFREKCWMAKFVIPDLLTGLDECLYLDADMYCSRDIYSLSLMDRKGLPLMAVQDAATVVAGKAWEYELLGLDVKAPYFNGGFMYFDLAAWRRENLSAKAEEVFRQAPHRLIDQSVFNLVFYGRWVALDEEWNIQCPFGYGLFGDFSRGRKFILHYITNPKPWQVPLADNTKEFYQALDKTPYVGWRPNALYWAVHFRTRTLKMYLSRWLHRISG